jgi:hypothetical protein
LTALLTNGAFSAVVELAFAAFASLANSGRHCWLGAEIVANSLVAGDLILGRPQPAST